MKILLMALSVGLIAMGILIEEDEKTMFTKNVFTNRKERGLEKHLSFVIGILGILFMLIAIIGGRV